MLSLSFSSEQQGRQVGRQVHGQSPSGSAAPPELQKQRKAQTSPARPRPGTEKGQAGPEPGAAIGDRDRRAPKRRPRPAQNPRGKRGPRRPPSRRSHSRQQHGEAHPASQRALRKPTGSTAATSVL